MLISPLYKNSLDFNNAHFCCWNQNIWGAWPTFGGRGPVPPGPNVEPPLVICVAELVWFCSPMHAHRCLSDPKCLFIYVVCRCASLSTTFALSQVSHHRPCMPWKRTMSSTGIRQKWSTGTGHWKWRCSIDHPGHKISNIYLYSSKKMIATKQIGKNKKYLSLHRREDRGAEGAEVERRRRENRGAEGVGCGKGVGRRCHPSHWKWGLGRGLCPLPPCQKIYGFLISKWWAFVHSGWYYLPFSCLFCNARKNGAFGLPKLKLTAACAQLRT